MNNSSKAGKMKTKGPAVQITRAHWDATGWEAKKRTKDGTRYMRTRRPNGAWQGWVEVYWTS